LSRHRWRYLSAAGTAPQRERKKVPAGQRSPAKGLCVSLPFQLNSLKVADRDEIETVSFGTSQLLANVIMTFYQQQIPLVQIPSSRITLAVCNKKRQAA
jgi:hypothetical protein